MIPRITPLPDGIAAPLAAMHAACFPEDPWDEAALGRILGLPGVFGHLAWQGDDPTGFILARDLGEEIEILTFGVLPEMRRFGIGRVLLAAVIGDAEQRRIGSLVLEVAADNDAARRLYAESGFVPVGRRPRYYRRADSVADAVILRRGIRDSWPPENLPKAN